MALVVSLIVSYFLYNRIKRQFAATTQLIRVVAAAKPLEPGTPITADYLTQIDWPSNFPLEGAFTKPEDVVGRIAVFSIAAKEPIREPLLAAAGAMVGLTSKIPDGMRAMAVETNDVTNVSGFLYPGCHVDVLVTFRPDVNRGNQDPVTATVLQNIQVLSTGERLQPDPSGKPQKVRQVTMLLTPEDAQKLVLAVNQGSVQFVLRNSDDQAQDQHRPVVLRDLQTFGPQAPVAARRAPTPAKPASTYDVETYDGTKKAVVKF